MVFSIVTVYEIFVGEKKCVNYLMGQSNVSVTFEMKIDGVVSIDLMKNTIKESGKKLSLIWSKQIQKKKQQIK